VGKDSIFLWDSRKRNFGAGKPTKKSLPRMAQIFTNFSNVFEFVVILKSIKTNSSIVKIRGPARIVRKIRENFCNSWQKIYYKTIF